MDGEHIYWSLMGACLVVGWGLGVSVAGEMGSAEGWMGMGARVHEMGRYLGSRLSTYEFLWK